MMNEKFILLVEDNEELNNFNKQLLQGQGFTVKTATTLSEARWLVKERPPNAIILDIGMPDGDGRDFLRELRQTSQIPVLMLTGYGEDKDIVLGFKTGCDDYLPKPYTFEVLLVRLLHLLQSAGRAPETVTMGSLTLDPVGVRAFLNGADMLLQPKEFFVLYLLAQNENVLMPAERIYETVWKQPMARNARSVKNAVYGLRKKLADGGGGYTITVARGEGYCFEKA